MIGPSRNFGSSSVPLTGSLHVDHAVAVLEQRDRELDRNRRRVLRIRLVAELQVVDHDVMLRVELAILDLVVQLGRELALADVVAGELAGVRIERRQLHVAEVHREVGVLRGREQVHLARDVDGRVVVDLARQLHLRARVRLRRQARDRARRARRCRSRTTARSSSRRKCRAIDVSVTVLMRTGDRCRRWRRWLRLGARSCSLRSHARSAAATFSVCPADDHARVGLARDDALDRESVWIVRRGRCR